MYRFVINYRYKTDKEKFNTSLDIWEVAKANEQGIYEGDCESYCRIVKHLNKQFKEWELYFCKINGNGHCILYKNGDVIDCNIKSVITFEQYCKIYKVTEFKKYNWFVVFSKILFSNMYLLYRKIRGI